MDKSHCLNERCEVEGLVTNDCIAFGVKDAQRFPLFMSREQLHRLALLRGKRDKAKINEWKLKGGISHAFFKDYFVQGNHSFSLSLVKVFDIRKGSGPLAL